MLGLLREVLRIAAILVFAVFSQLKESSIDSLYIYNNIFFSFLFLTVRLFIFNFFVYLYDIWLEKKFS